MDNVYVKLFLLFLKINLLSPSGPASYGVTQKLIVPEYVSADEFARFTAIAAGIPGSDAVQMAWQTGYAVSKLPGAVISVIGALLPCIALAALATASLRLVPVALLNKFFDGVKPALFLLLLGYAVKLVFPVQGTALKTAAILVLSYVLIVKNVSPIVILTAAGIIGLL